jgi:hypothetical protein
MSANTLRERIAEWRGKAAAWESDGEYNVLQQPVGVIAAANVRKCAAELTPIAEALEAVVREMPHMATSPIGSLNHAALCFRCRFELILGKVKQDDKA